MRFEFIRAEKAHYPVRVMCQVLAVSPSGFYAWQGRPLMTPQVRANEVLRMRIRAVHAASRGCYGSPRIHAALRADGTHVGRNRVIRLMRADQLRGRPRRRFRVTTISAPEATHAPNHLRQRFAVSAPNRVWTADITALPTAEGWLFVAVLLDLWSRRLVGWAISDRADSALVSAAWRMAVTTRQPVAGLVHHSDRGAQYTSEVYQSLLRARGVQCSMSRPGNCWDNAPTESFFRTLKVELGPGPWRTRTDSMHAIATFVAFYNQDRLHSSLGYQSPVNFEHQFRGCRQAAPEQASPNREAGAGGRRSTRM